MVFYNGFSAETNSEKLLLVSFRHENVHARSNAHRLPRCILNKTTIETYLKKNDSERNVKDDDPSQQDFFVSLIMIYVMLLSFKSRICC